VGYFFIVTIPIIDNDYYYYYTYEKKGREGKVKWFTGIIVLVITFIIGTCATTSEQELDDTEGG
jgi:hypothetical protein